VQVNAEALGNTEWITALNTKLVSELSAEGFQQKIDDILSDVKLGPSSVRRNSEKSEPLLGNLYFRNWETERERERKKERERERKRF
jgi:hypothetical protein